jgi:hypothetical protein
MNDHQQDPTVNSESLLSGMLGNSGSDDEVLRAFHRAFLASARFPIHGFVLGQPVLIASIDYDGNPRRGLTAVCRKHDGAGHTISLADVHCADAAPVGRCLAAYRKWLGLNEASAPTAPAQQAAVRNHKAEANDLDLTQPIALVIVSVNDRTARCRIPGLKRELTLRSGMVWQHVPGEIVTVRGKKFWSYARHPYLSGEIESARIDPTALELGPLQLNPAGIWDPQEEFWGEEDHSIPEWAKPFVEQGPRPRFEMDKGGVAKEGFLPVRCGCPFK